MQFNCFRFQHTHLITGLLKVFSAVGSVCVCKGKCERLYKEL